MMVKKTHCGVQKWNGKILVLSNSIPQKEHLLPVMMDGQEDTLWCTEMER